MSHRIQPQGHDAAAEAELGAYNRAFSELGLEWYWDARTYESLKTCAGDKDCVQAYIEGHMPHLLHAYAGNSLATAVDKIRRRVSEASAH